MLSKSDLAWLRRATREEAWGCYNRVWTDGNPRYIAELAKADRFFLLTWVLNRPDANKDWLYARCREVEADSEGYLDLWFREGYKSTIITFAGIIQEILRDPEITIGIFSHNQKVARKFLGQIKYEFESNSTLRNCFPDIVWNTPHKEAQRWSVDRGIVLKRKSNPKESTVEAYGLVDGMPTGAHFKLLVYDDVVTVDSVTTPEMMKKTTDAWALSLNLGAKGGRAWYIGTRYHFNDTYRTILERRVVKERRHAATKDGTKSGEPVFLDRATLDEKYDAMGPYIFSAQMLLNPVAEAVQGFKREWLKYYERAKGAEMNRYLFCDPASSKKKESDYTVYMVVGLGSDRCYYILDIVRDRMNLTERADTLFNLHRAWTPISVGYEKYGKDSDIEFFQERMRLENYHFVIFPIGDLANKEDRIRRLVPRFEQGKIILPEKMEKIDFEGRTNDLVNVFVEQEYVGFPVARHDDMMDCLSQVVSPLIPTAFPEGEELPEPPPEPKKRYQIPKAPRGSWMAA